MIGQGAFGQVVKAHDLCMDKSVAIKISLGTQQEIASARNEAQMLGRLEGTAQVVDLFNSFEQRGFHFIVMELMGPTLLSQIRRRSLQLDQVKSVTSQLLDGLKELKRKGVIHCDLKPENILFTPTLDRIKICDFGSSCLDYSSGFKYVQSRFYRAPEVVLGLRYTCQVDMWSLGCIVSEMLRGRPLFPARNQQELLGMMQEYSGPMPLQMLDSSANRHHPADLNLLRRQDSIPSEKETFVKDCLRLDPFVRLTCEQASVHPWLQKTYKLH